MLYTPCGTTRALAELRSDQRCSSTKAKVCFIIYVLGIIPRMRNCSVVAFVVRYFLLLKPDHAHDFTSAVSTLSRVNCVIKRIYRFPRASCDCVSYGCVHHLATSPSRLLFSFFFFWIYISITLHKKLFLSTLLALDMILCLVGAVVVTSVDTVYI